jgi:molybdopterin-guanine dinucleotide biosynthesis protein MobB
MSRGERLIPVISVVGHSGSGKTTLLEKLIRELKKRGYRLAVVKHHYHTDFEIDVPGKDSYRYAQAGADEVLIAAPNKVVSIRHLEGEPSLADVVARVQDVDLVITEGYKQAGAPKIEVYRTEQMGECSTDPVLLSPPEELIAVVSDRTFELAVPTLDPEDVAGLADLIEDRFLVGG